MPALSDVAPEISTRRVRKYALRAVHNCFHQYVDHSIYCTTIANLTFQVSVDAVFQQPELFYYNMPHVQSVIHFSIHPKFLDNTILKYQGCRPPPRRRYTFDIQKKVIRTSHLGNNSQYSLFVNPTNRGILRILQRQINAK
jgi:hypothetical protein